MIHYTDDLIRALAKKHHRPQAHFHDALAQILDEITEQLEHGHTVRLTGFGIFYTRKQPASKIKDFRTRKEITVPARRVAAFRVGKLLKDAVLRQSKSRLGWLRKSPKA